MNPQPIRIKGPKAKRTRLLPKVRKAQILAAALELAERDNFAHLTFAKVGRAARCARTTAVYHFGSVKQLQAEVMRAAVRSGSLKVIAQGIVAQHRAALSAPVELKRQALASLKA